jgi:uncharacterized Fe-S cluster-containing radical SAM superfamily protein
MNSIPTDEYSADLRTRAIRPETQQILISRIAGSDQELDLSEPPNCDGYGRVRHFRLTTTPPWPTNQLPIAPASHALGIPTADVMTAQVFQNAACNWRCWYCFVPFSMLSAKTSNSAWLSAAEMIDLYLAEAEDHRPLVIDCSGGQPDLVPEWVPWMLRELRKRGLGESVYLWSDDNLSNDYFWRYVSPPDRQLLASSSHYGRVCCFKGFDEASFAFNTKAAPSLFTRQFEPRKQRRWRSTPMKSHTVPEPRTAAALVLAAAQGGHEASLKLSMLLVCVGRTAPSDGARVGATVLMLAACRPDSAVQVTV